MAGRGPDERWGRLARLDRGEVKARLSGFPEERPERRNATSGAPGGAGGAQTARGTSQRCQRYVAPNGAPLPLWREEGNEGGAPRLTTSGADESRLYEGRCLSQSAPPPRASSGGGSHKRVHARLRRAMASEPGIQMHT